MQDFYNVTYSTSAPDIHWISSPGSFFFFFRLSCMLYAWVYYSIWQVFFCFVLFCSIAFRFTSGWEKLRYLFFRVELDSSNWLIHWPIPSSFSNGSFLSFSAYYNIVVCVCVLCVAFFFLLFKREMPSRINRLIHPERAISFMWWSVACFFYFLLKFFSSLSYPFMNIHEWNEFGPSSSSRKPIALYIFGFLIFDDYINRLCSSSSSFWPSHVAVCVRA